jgi:peptidyl-Lys metalloendopeptidase
MRKTLTVVAVLVLMSVGTAFAAGVRASLELDRGWMGEHEDLVASVTLVNDSQRAMVIPRWLVPGAKLDANLFEVTRDGELVTYTGILVKRAPSRNDFVALLPGQSVTGRTELTKHYDIRDGGEYIISYRANLLDSVDAAELRLDSQLVESNAVAIWKDGPVSGPRFEEDLTLAPMAGTLTFTNCSSSQESGVSSAEGAATTYSTGAKNYLNGKTWNTVGPRYTTWFGAMDSNRFNTVKSHYVAIEDAFINKNIVVDCGCTDPYYAYVYPAQHYKIYVCNAFWSAPNTGTDSKAGTLVHEMSHFNVVASTDDWAYGQTA